MRPSLLLLAVALAGACDATAGTPATKPPPPPRAPAGAPGGPPVPGAGVQQPSTSATASSAPVEPWAKALNGISDQVPAPVREALDAKIAAREGARKAEARALAAARTRLVAELYADPASPDARKLGKELLDRERASFAAERAFAIGLLRALPPTARERFRAGGDLGRLVVDPVASYVDAVKTPLPAALVSAEGAGDRAVDPLAAARWRLSAAATPVDEAAVELRAVARDASLDDASIADVEGRLAALADALVAFQGAKLDQLAWLRGVLPVASTRSLLDQVAPEELVQVLGPRADTPKEGLAVAMLGARDPVAANEEAVAANWEVGTRQLPLEETTTPVHSPAQR
ncbi:MAG: hypothetical protein ACOZNI_25920 [Myxococcota bacterium]